MNVNTASPECYHRMHSACDYEDCACRCHLREHFEDHQDTEADPDED